MSPQPASACGDTNYVRPSSQLDVKDDKIHQQRSQAAGYIYVRIKRRTTARTITNIERTIPPSRRENTEGRSGGLKSAERYQMPAAWSMGIPAQPFLLGEQQHARLAWQKMQKLIQNPIFIHAHARSLPGHDVSMSGLPTAVMLSHISAHTADRHGRRRQ